MENTERKLPLVAFIIDEDSDEPALQCNALVDSPAIQKTWMFFNKQEPIKFAADTDRRIITGPIMVPNLPIFRKDEYMGEYNGFFTKETIWQIFLQWYAKGKTIPVNLMHNDERPVNEAYMFEFFIVDRSRGILAPEGLGNMQDGTAIASYYVKDKKFWDEYIKTGIVRGFSIEGLFKTKYIVDKSETETDAVAQRILNMREQLKKMKNFMY